ncbi:MAG: alpha/beta hydrolase, partial [Deltaproteobacteria bacterium]|nr:alpha/beta hydrolase [Deltaproteobacteria bacterium]
ALVFDYRHFGDSDGEPRLVLDIGKQLDDWRGAVRFARTMPVLDGEFLALWGTSFSGGHVITIAAEDERVAAVVAQAPFVDGLASARAAGPGLTARLSWSAMRDIARAARGREPFRIKVAGPPGSLAAMTAPGLEFGYRTVVPEDGESSDEVAARVFLSIPTYRPIGVASRIRCPVLFCVADRDRVAPPSPALAAARRVARAEIRRYDADHFDLYVGEGFERTVSDQVEFLLRALAHRAGPGKNGAP